jgi:hypothetical protein
MHHKSVWCFSINSDAHTAVGGGMAGTGRTNLASAYLSAKRAGNALNVKHDKNRNESGAASERRAMP